MSFEIENIYRSKCSRCDQEKEVEATTDNLVNPLISVVTLNSLNYKGEIIEELVGEEYYICDDCWNEALDFFRNKITR